MGKGALELLYRLASSSLTSTPPRNGFGLLEYFRHFPSSESRPPGMPAFDYIPQVPCRVHDV